jgi:RND superfamily putative drug exporter
VAAAPVLLLGAPFLQDAFGRADDPSGPAGAHVAAVRDVLREAFPARDADALAVVSRATLPTVDLLPYASELSSLPDVARVDTAHGSFVGGLRVSVAGPPALADGEGTWVSVVPVVEPGSGRGAALVHAVRDLPAPARVLVGGDAARLVDTRAAVQDAVPWALLLVVLPVGALLVALTGSVIVAVRALAVGVLSVAATLAVLVWGWRAGLLDDLAGAAATAGTSDPAIVALACCLASGLALGHAVVALSRVPDAREPAGDGTAAGAGVEASRRTVQPTAVLVAMALAPVAIADVGALTLLAAGLTVAVVVGATLVRSFLVPAVAGPARPARGRKPAASRGPAGWPGRTRPRAQPAAADTRQEPEPDVLVADPAWFAALAASTGPSFPAPARD